jgi:type IV secretory pathway TraG/TraD family ATPase VirD4
LLFPPKKPQANEPDPALHIAGRRLISQEAARAQADKVRSPGDPGVAWGNSSLPFSTDELFFLIAGSIGSGKTKQLVQLLSSIVPTITPGSDRRLLAFDPKNELYSILAAMRPPVPVITLNPADLRSHAWDLARDVTAPATALQVACALVPREQGEHNPFFDRSVRNLFAGVLQDLLLVVPRRYTLRDVVLILCSEHYVRQVIERNPYNQHLRKAFEPDITWKSIETTIISKLAELRILAAFWHHARHKVSFQEWVSSQSSILLLGMDPRIETTLAAVNRLVIKRLSEVILAGPEGTPKRTYAFFDEFPALGGDLPVPGLGDLCHRGRGRGARLGIVIQTIEDLRRIYTDHGAHALMAEFGNRLLLRTEDRAQADWCSGVMGDTEDWEEEVSETEGDDNSSTTRRKVRYKRPLVPPANFMIIPPANPTNGLTGYALSPYVDGAWQFNISGAWVAQHLPRANPFVPAFVPRPTQHQYLPPFTDEDLARLKLRREPRLPRRGGPT